MKRFAYPLAIAVVCLLLAGCWDRREINDLAFVTGTALDKEEDGYRLSVQFPLPSQLGGAGSSGGGGGTGGGSPVYNDSATGQTVREANDNLQSSLSRYLNYSHRRTIVVGEEAAKAGIAEVLDIMGRFPQNRLSAFFLVSKGKAQDVMNMEVSLEKMPAEMVRELAVQYFSNAKSIKDVVFALLEEGIDPTAPYIVRSKTNTGERGKPKDTIKVEGLAIFKHDRLVGFLKQDEAQALLMVMNEALNPVITVPAPRGEGYVSLRLLNFNAKIRHSFSGGAPQFDIFFDGKATISENNSKAKFFLDTNDMRKLDHAMNRQLEKQVSKAMAKLQNFGGDPVGFGNLLYHKAPSYWKKNRKHWYEIFPQCTIKVHSSMFVENPGTITLPLAVPRDEMVEP